MAIGQFIGRLSFISILVGFAMIFLGESLTGCLAARGAPAGPNCNPYSNPLSPIIVFSGVGLLVLGFWLILYRRPKKTGKAEPFAPNEEGFYPLKNLF